MQSSHSAAPPLPNDADLAEAGPAARIRRRSSLDTFVIPGRTRLPSSRVGGTMDTHIAESLLNPKSHKSPKKHSNRVSKSSWLASKNRKSPMSKEIARSIEEASVFTPSEEHTKKPKSKLKQKPSLHKAILVDPQKGPETQGLVPQTSKDDVEKYPVYLNDDQLYIAQLDNGGSQTHSSVAQPQEHSLPGEDNPGNSSDRPQSEGSRVTSTTWSSVSRIDFSNSSDNTRNRGSSKSVEEYNVLAIVYGLPPIELTPDIMSIGMSSFIPIYTNTNPLKTMLFTQRSSPRLIATGLSESFCVVPPLQPTS